MGEKASVRDVELSIRVIRKEKERLRGCGSGNRQTKADRKAANAG